NPVALERVLSAAPHETALWQLSTSPALLSVPLPDGRLVHFRIQASSVLDNGFAERFPEIKSYRGGAVDNSALTLRCDWSPLGFHALVLSSDQAFNVLPARADDRTIYASLTDQSFAAVRDDFSCSVTDLHKINPWRTTRRTPNVPVGPTLR